MAPRHVMLQLVVVLSFIACGLCQHTAHDAHAHEGPFEHVKEFLGVTTEELTDDQTTLLIRHVLYRAMCDKQGLDCINCLPTPNILDYLGRATANTLHEDGFNQLSVILVVYLRNLPAACANTNEWITNKTRAYSVFLTEFAADAHGHGVVDPSAPMQVDLHVLESILQIMAQHQLVGNLTLNATGEKLPRQSVELDYTNHLECFGPISLFSELNVSTNAPVFGYVKLEELAALIISKIVQGQCISQHDLPHRESFLTELMIRYGSAGNIHVEGLTTIMSKMSIGIETSAAPPPADDPHAGHDHKRRKRSEADDMDMAQYISHSRRQKRQVVTTEHSKIDIHSVCYNPGDLLQLYTDSRSGVLGPDDFKNLCPALIQQALGSMCKEDPAEVAVRHGSTDAEAYGYGTISVFIICLCSLLGAAFVQIKNDRTRTIILCHLMALSVGTLCGDAVLHLIPMALGVHDHPDTDEIIVDVYIWKLTALLFSLFLFYNVEVIMNRRGRGHSHDVELVVVKSVTSIQEKGSKAPQSSENGSINGSMNIDTQVVPANGTVPLSELIELESKKKAPPLTPLALMVLVGDGIHNLADGLAIGAAFSFSVSSGISTSLAVLCHELPHELGDFAALITTGLSLKRAMVMNFISGLSAFIGLYIGVAAGSNEDARSWVFVLAAGMFLYVALANIVPELMKHYKKANFTIMYVAQNVGILLGYLGMLLIAIFESKIKV